MRNPGRAGLVAGALVALMAAPLAAQGDGQSAQQIVDRMLSKNTTLGVDSGGASLTLLVQDRAGTRKLKKLDVRSKSIVSNGRTLIKLTAPKEVRGQSFLFSENKSAEDDVWMYLPAFGVTRRIEGSQKKGAFLGSHFSFSDLESRDIKSATHERLADEKIAKTPVFVIASTPKTPATSDYGRVVSYVRKSDDTTLRVKFYAKDAKTLVKTLFVEKLDKTKKGQVYAKQMTLHVAKGGSTTVVIDNVDEGTALPDALFTREQLGK